MPPPPRERFVRSASLSHPAVNYRFSLCLFSGRGAYRASPKGIGDRFPRFTDQRIARRRRIDGEAADRRFSRARECSTISVINLSSYDTNPFALTPRRGRERERENARRGSRRCEQLIARPGTRIPLRFSKAALWERGITYALEHVNYRLTLLRSVTAA